MGIALGLTSLKVTIYDLQGNVITTRSNTIHHGVKPEHFVRWSKQSDDMGNILNLVERPPLLF